jgi:hypothetical protein
MEVELFMKHKSSYLAAFIDFSTHSLYFLLGMYLLWYFRYSTACLFTIPFMSLMGSMLVPAALLLFEMTPRLLGSIAD